MLLFLVGFLVDSVYAQCWRNTPCTGPSQAAFPGAWDKFNYAPASRTVLPATTLTWPDLTPSAYLGSSQLSGNGSLVTFDFGIEVGGIVSLDWTSNADASLGLAFTESKKFVGEWSDSSNGLFTGYDGAIYGSVSVGSGSYTMPDKSLRGGFRYLTIFLLANDTSTNVTISDIHLEIGFQPTWTDLRAYQGYFHCSDDLLNRIWYAGAYTLQTNAVPTDTGRQVPMLTYGWANNATLSNGTTVIVDGAKRDRAVWPGDMGVAVPSAFVSTGDLDSVKNALQVMYDYQNTTTGAFDESGPPLSQKGSDTYHMWTMIGTYNYVLYSNDIDWLLPLWSKYQQAMTYVVDKVDSTGLMNVTGIRDWARWQQGFHNTEANMILYHALTTGSELARWLNETVLASSCTSQASELATAINALTYESAASAYRDNDTSTTLQPQDANSLSLLFDVAPNNAIAGIANALKRNWTPLGPVTPELPENISPFISSFELLGRLRIRDTLGALELLRTLWGWVINNPLSTESTLIEGYLANGSFSYRSSRGYGYDESYVSHAHGWSTGPTSGLTNYILGLDVIEPAGSVWSLSPQVGNLAFAEGGFVTGLGRFSARWEVDGSTVKLNWSTPLGTAGRVTVPANGKGNRDDGTMSESAFGETLVTTNVPGGDGSLSFILR